MKENINNTTKGWFLGLLLFALLFLYLGGSICAVIFAVQAKSLVPAIATLVVIAFGVPTAVRIVQKMSGGK